MHARTLRSRMPSLVLLLVLAGCSGLPPVQRPTSPCEVSEASYECQMQRYHDVSAD